MVMTFGLSHLIKKCRRMCKTNSNDPTEIFKCVGNFSFSNKFVSTVTLGTMYMKKTIRFPLTAIPGNEFHIPFELRDELSNVTSAVYHVSVRNIDNSRIIIDTAYTYIANGRLKVYGMPGHRARLTLTKTGERQMVVTFNICLKHCPPDFVIHNITNFNQQHLSLCVCAVNTDQTYQGIAWCNSTHYYAYAKRGVWFGYEGDYFHTAHCPYRYCSSGWRNNDTHIPQIYSLITEASLEKLDEVVCTSERTGILCGKCISNHSVSYHSYNLKCGPNDMCTLGWLLYITSELLPLTLLFLTVIFFNISFTTETISGFIFFAQVIDSLVINGHGSIWLKSIIYKLTQVYQFFIVF